MEGIREGLLSLLRTSQMTLLVLLCLVAAAAAGKTPSGLYTDDGHGHTILTQRFSKRDVREISFDILSIMGLHHRPHPHLVEDKSPASAFLKEVYNSLLFPPGDSAAQNVDLSNGRTGRKTSWVNEKPSNLTHSQFNVDQKEVEAILQADSIVSFANRGHKFSSDLKDYEDEKQFWFDVSEVSDLDLVLGAELRLWKKALKDEDYYEDYNYNYDVDKSQVLSISARQIIPGKTKGSFDFLEEDEVITGKWEQGWLRLNVTNAFRSWIVRGEENMGLVISTKTAESGNEIPISETGLATALDKESIQPFLVAFLKAAEGSTGRVPPPKRPPRRSKRETETERKKKGKGNRRHQEFVDILERTRSCQMGMLYVNFEDLGWKDWVIAPDGFIAYYCHGECSFPLTAAMNATNHAIVSTLVHTYYPLEYPKPSCSPVKLGSISMLYYDDNSNVTVKKYKDMVIKSCGCK